MSDCHTHRTDNKMCLKSRLSGISTVYVKGSTGMSVDLTGQDKINTPVGNLSGHEEQQLLGLKYTGTAGVGILGLGKLGNAGQDVVLSN